MSDAMDADDRYGDLLTEADELMAGLRAALNDAAGDVRPDWGHVGSMADQVVGPMADALKALQAVIA